MNREEAKRLSEVLKAYSEGKIIQWSWNNCDSWNTIVEPWNFETNIDKITYRVKPEPKYRPYKNAKEFLTAQKEHGIYLGLVNRREEDDLFIPDRVNSLGIQWVSIIGNRIFKNYNDLALNYAWQDDTPCGIMKE